MAKLQREAWPPNLMRLTAKDLITEAPMHPKQLALKRNHMARAEAYWRFGQGRDTP
jgi:hypothetical protein